jgi:hypothetical protein
MRLDTMAATSMSGAAAAALAITAYMAIVGGNGLAYVVLFGLLEAQVAAACAVAKAGRHKGSRASHLLHRGSNSLMLPALLSLPFPILPSPQSHTSRAPPAS